MSRVRVSSYGISIDGFSAGPRQDLKHPLGVNGEDLMEWMFHTREFAKMQGRSGGETGVDNSVVEQGFEGLGAWILGRNMFGPVRGPWPDDQWKGWWGDEPSYHLPVFVLTHHARAPIQMKGGTTFHFVTDGVHSALKQAKAAAGDRDVRIGGGAATIRQYLSEGLVDDVHLVVRPIVMGSGERPLDGMDLRALGYKPTKHLAGERAMHVYLAKQR